VGKKPVGSAQGEEGKRREDFKLNLIGTIWGKEKLESWGKDGQKGGLDSGNGK